MRLVLAGVGRSGTTWIGNVLARARDTRYVYEPDGPLSDVLGHSVAERLGDYPLLEPGERSRWYELTWDLAFAGGWPWDKVEAARSAGRRLVRMPAGVREALVASLARSVVAAWPKPANVVVKSVNALLSLEWLAERYDAQVALVRRRPLSVISSWMALGWTPPPLELDARIGHKLLQPLAIPPAPPGADPLTRAAWAVGLLTLALKQAAAAHPDWVVVRYEDLAADPVVAMADLHRRLGLEPTRATAAYLERSAEAGHTAHHGSASRHPNAHAEGGSGSRPDADGSAWRRRLTPAETRRALAVLAPFRLGDWGDEMALSAAAGGRGGTG